MPKVGIEPTTYRLQGGCSTRLSYTGKLGAPAGIRTQTFGDFKSPACYQLGYGGLNAR